MGIVLVASHCERTQSGENLSEPKNVMTLLRAFELEAAKRASDLAPIDDSWRIGLNEAVREFFADENVAAGTVVPLPEHDLLSKLKLRAQLELVGEQELLLIEQAASLAQSLSKLACQSLEIDAAKLLSIQRQDFVATLTHDLKNPIVGANRILEFLIDGRLGPLNTEQQDVLEQIRHSNIDTLCLIKTLTDAYRNDTIPGRLDLHSCDLVPIVKSSFEEMKSWSLSKQIATSLDVPSDTRMTMLDSTAVHRLLDNLLNNAVKFVPLAGGTINVRVSYIDDEAIIEVQNNGSSISADERQFLFQRFSQGAVGKRYSGGSGLGLFNCRQIAEAHGGGIECLKCDEGALFKVRFPLKQI